MENQNKNAEISQKTLEPLDQRELELIHWIRTRFRYGQVIIETRDGKPYRILKVTEYQTLG